MAVCTYKLTTRRQDQEDLFGMGVHTHAYCGRLNVIGPHNLMGSGTLNGVALLEAMRQCEGGL